MDELKWDKKLNIRTAGRDASHADTYHYPYEPTPYVVLQRLAESGYIEKESRVIDYGCGKGRVGFFLVQAVGCHAIGVEYDENIYRQAMENHRRYAKQQNIDLVCMDAECFQVRDADCFYFFNPFSVEILKSVMVQIIDSYYEDPREMYLFFYYPNDEYLAYLMTRDELMFVDEIDCQDLFDGENERERILVFEII